MAKPIEVAVGNKFLEFSIKTAKFLTDSCVAGASSLLPSSSTAIESSDDNSLLSQWSLLNSYKGQLAPGLLLQFCTKYRQREGGGEKRPQAPLRVNVRLKRTITYNRKVTIKIHKQQLLLQ